MPSILQLQTQGAGRSSHSPPFTLNSHEIALCPELRVDDVVEAINTINAAAETFAHVSQAALERP